MRRYATALIVLAAALAGAGSPAGAQSRQKREKSFQPGGRIHGYLVDPSGRGLSGIVVLCTPDGRKLRTTHSSAMKKGRFDLDELEPGTYTLHVDTVGPVIENLGPPADTQVVVRRKEIIRPHLVAVPGDHVSAPRAAGKEK